MCTHAWCSLVSQATPTFFQCMHEESERAWYQKSRDRCHDCVMLRSEKVGFKLELFQAICSLQAFILCLFVVYNSTFYSPTLHLL